MDGLLRKMEDPAWLAKALTDEVLEQKIKFGYTAGGELWRQVRQKAAEKLRQLARLTGMSPGEEVCATSGRSETVPEPWEG